MVDALPDIIGPNLDVLFCGINPGLYSARVGHHFARPGNRFWPALHAGGFTRRRLEPSEDHLLLELGLGLTNLAPRATAGASDLTRTELVAGRRALVRKIRRYAPRWVAVLGIQAYRVAFGRRHATFGLQAEQLGPAGIWVLPNPSGLNAAYQLSSLARAFRELRAAASSLKEQR